MHNAESIPFFVLTFGVPVFLAMLISDRIDIIRQGKRHKRKRPVRPGRNKSNNRLKK